ncbi:MAG: hypothetical protein IPJ13_15445 [Saprospiraceae bacterium]|nr:hypothetical protein [Saprospiraceae bacterium]
MLQGKLPLSGVMLRILQQENENFSAFFKSEREARNLARTKLGKMQLRLSQINGEVLMVNGNTRSKTW